MSENTVSITVKGTNKSKPAFDEVNQQTSKMSKGLKEFGRTVSANLTAGAITEFAGRFRDLAADVIRAGSELQDTTNAVDKTFNESAVVIKNWGERNAGSFGLARSEFQRYSAVLGSMLKNQGFDLQETTDWTIKLTERAADMASVMGTDVSQALEAIGAGLRGESDPLEQFGVSLNEAAVQAEALAETGKKSASELTTTEKATARLNLILKQTEHTAGDFADTSDDMANAQKRAAAEFENAKAALGESLLPVVAKATVAVADLLSATQHLGDALNANIPGLTGPLFKDLEGNADRIKTLDETLAGLVRAGHAREAAEQMVELSDKAAEAGLTAEDLGALFPKYGRALAQVARASEAAAASGGELVQSMEDLRTEADALSDGMLDSRKAIRDLEAAFDDANAAAKENGRTLDVATEAGRNNEAALDDIAKSARDAAQAVLDAGGSQAEADAITRRATTQFVRAARAMGLEKTEAEALAKKLLAIPKQVTTTIRAVDSATRVVDGVYQRLQWLNGRTAFVNVVSTNRNAIEGRASGGVVSGLSSAATGGARGNRVLVGEYGPEIVDLAPGSRVSSNADTRRMMSSGNGGVGTVVLELRSAGSAADDLLLEWLRRAIRIRGGDIDVILKG